jgi:hypothetical protein
VNDKGRYHSLFLIVAKEHWYMLCPSSVAVMRFPGPRELGTRHRQTTGVAPARTQSLTTFLGILYRQYLDIGIVASFDSSIQNMIPSAWELHASCTRHTDEIRIQG